jgi:hypothetical protein
MSTKIPLFSLSPDSSLGALTMYCQVLTCMGLYIPILLTQLVNIQEGNHSWTLPSSSRIV